MFSHSRFLLPALAPAFTLGAFLMPTEAQADPIGSYAGASVGLDRNDSSNLNIAVDGVYSFSENFQVRGTLGDGLGIVAPTASFTKGYFRLAAGPGLRWVERSTVVPVFNENGELAFNGEGFPQTEPSSETDFNLIGLLAAEAALNDYMVVYANAIISDDISGSVGVGIRF